MAFPVVRHVSELKYLFIFKYIVMVLSIVYGF